MEKVYKVNFENGYYLFKLEQLLDDKKISINKVMRDTGTDYKVIKRMSTGELSKIDMTIIDRLCNYLDCEENEIYEYVRNKKNTKQ